MLDFIWAFNSSIFIFFTVFYSFQIVYIIIALFSKIKKPAETDSLHRYGVIIAARDEEAVICELIRSIKEQSYPQELLDIYVIADNCSDNTAEVSKNEGAYVIERHDLTKIGKGYALDYAYSFLKDEGRLDLYDGFFVFDADNVLDKDFVAEMNKYFSLGYRAVTGYRNSKNYGDNSITSAYSLWFLHEAAFLNKPRMVLNTCCTISGTGYLVSADYIKKAGGWRCFSLTEDIEFNAQCILDGDRIGYCEDAVFYDEQPQEFKQSWDQRLRWMRGTYQVIMKYGAKLFISMFKSKPLAKYDLLMSIAPALIVTFVSVAVNLVCFLIASFEILVDLDVIRLTALSFLQTLVSFYFVFAGLAGLTLISERKRIKATLEAKILSVFTFPFFVFTYIPISIIAIFKKVTWTPIKHSVIKSAQDLSN